MHRFFVPPEKILKGTVTIDDPHELHHAQRVLRLGVGDRVACFDGRGHAYTGTITSQDARQLLIRIERESVSAAQAPIWLAPALIKGERFDWLVQKATELGATRLCPLATQRTIVKLSAEQGRQKCERWRRIALAAAKQCGQSNMPQIDPPQSLTQVFSAVPAGFLVLMPTLAVPTVSIRELFSSRPAPAGAVLLIGPEGDFSPEEVARAVERGAQAVSLGALTLRTETAAMAALSILRYELDSV